MTNLDPVTGLPKLADGFRFFVRYRNTQVYGVYQTHGYEVCVQEYKKGLFGSKWKTVDRTPIYMPGKDGKSGSIALELNDANIRAAAETLAEKNLEDKRLQDLEERYLGAYPPKSL